MIELVFRAPAIKIRLHKLEPAVELHEFALLNLHCSRCDSTLNPDVSSSIPEAISHVLAEPGTIASDHVRSEQFAPAIALAFHRNALQLLP